MSGLRRSGRIAKQIQILLVGTDMGGKVFCEQTSTVLLSRHGAGIVSRHRISPDGVLTVRLPGTEKEAEIRLVGPMGSRGDGSIFGVAFCDAELDFWEIEFPPPSAAPDQGQLEGVTLQCAMCEAREFVQQIDVESDVYALNQSILRHCQSCGLTTNWAQARPGKPGRPGTSPSHSPAVRPAPSTDSRRAALLDKEAAAKAAIDLLEPEPVPSAPAAPAQRKNRRRDVRTRVNFTACIRHPAAGEEIVECDNISKSGFSFRSQKQYSKDSIIQVSLPHSPGNVPIFVFASIKHVEDLFGGNFFRYGAAYMKTSGSSRNP